jgi:hypothetical protein
MVSDGGFRELEALVSIVVLVVLVAGMGAQYGTERIRACFALLLPAKAKPRFVAEAQGNLGNCERWWQRVDHPAGLVLGMPRLAWMMRHDSWRRRV